MLRVCYLSLRLIRRQMIAIKPLRKLTPAALCGPDSTSPPRLAVQVRNTLTDGLRATIF